MRDSCRRNYVQGQLGCTPHLNFAAVMREGLQGHSSASRSPRHSQAAPAFTGDFWGSVALVMWISDLIFPILKPLPINLRIGL